MIVDFHVHSTASDGTFAPTEIATQAKNFDAIALTDHDNCAGVSEFTSALIEESSVKRIAGIELSINPGIGFDRFHLLGLGIDPTNTDLIRFLQRVLKERDLRNLRISERFRKLGIEVDDPVSPVSAYANGKVLARPHYARWLVDHRYGTSIAEMFEKYLTPTSPAATRCYEDRWHPNQEEAFAVIHSAGGVCVMAHPKYWRDKWKTSAVEYSAAERELAVLKEKGLDGLECLYQANCEEENVEFTRIAIRLGLLKSAGSDFHGANKPAIGLGMQVEESFIAPLLERLDIRD